MIVNTHERWLAAPPAVVGALLDGLAGPDDGLWPRDRWPAMRLDRPLGVGARGGHGPVRYRVENYRPGSVVRFRFERPAGFDGHHAYVVVPRSSGTVLRHDLVMRTRGAARLTWPLFFRPLHDALIEDSLERAARSLGLPSSPPDGWPLRVRALRALGSRLAGAATRSVPVTGTARSSVRTSRRRPCPGGHDPAR